MGENMVETVVLSYAQYDRLLRKYRFREPNPAVLEVREDTVIMDRQKLEAIKHDS